MLINHLLPVFFPVSNPLVNRRLIVLVLTPRVVAASTMLICMPTSLPGGLPGWVLIGRAELRQLGILGRPACLLTIVFTRYYSAHYGDYVALFALSLLWSFNA